MDELKNLVIQSLETNGVLGQVRAQLRSCVFKVIDNQDQVESRRSSFHWENQRARELRDSQKSTLIAELIREFLEFYHLDYTLAIYKPECNLQGDLDRSKLGEQAGFNNGIREDQPILMQLLDGFMSGGLGIGSSAPLGAGSGKLASFQKPGTFDQINKQVDVGQTESHLAKGQNLLQEIERENKSGFQLGDKSSDDEFDKPKFNLNSKKPEKDLHKVSSGDGIGDNYDDDFDDDIEEDLPAEQQEEVQIEDTRNQPAAVSGSGHGITVSQSLGVDPSVDSLALEDYDYTEPVERIG